MRRPNSLHGIWEMVDIENKQYWTLLTFVLAQLIAWN